MSIFPAYSETQPMKEEATTNEWLENKSFRPEYAGLLQELSKSTDRTKSEDSSSVSSDGERLDSPQTRPEPQEINLHEVERKRKHPQDDDRHSRSKKKKKEKKKSKKKHKHKDRHRHRSPEEKQSEQDKFSPSYLQKYHLKVVFIEDIPGLPAEKAFREDRKADPSNWQFGELYKMHIAKYFLYTRNVLGSNMLLSSGKKVKNTSKSSVRYHSKGKRLPRDSAKDLVMDLSPFLKVTDKPILTGKSNGREDFIRIADETPHKKGSGGVYNPLGVYDQATEMYIKGRMPEVPDKQQQTDVMTSAWKVVQDKVANYNRHLHEHPGDVDMWLEFLDFQDEAVMLQEDQADTERQKKRDSLVQEIKESVIAKALQKNPASLPLQLAQLTLCRFSWESGTLRKAWRQLTFHHPNDPSVWWLYLEHIRTTFTSFTVSTMCKAYGKCIKTLWEILSGNMLSHRPLPYTQQHILDIIMELVVILWQCGHMERASAICQALLEFNLNCPEVLKEATISDRLEFLEAFWDGSLPRVGEDDAQGWRHWVDTKGDNARFGHMYTRVEEENLEEELMQQHTSSQHDAWVALEGSRSSRHWLPWHPNVEEGEGEEDCEDPERLVLFDDIKDFICAFSEPQQQLKILTTYLALLGVEVNVDLPSDSQAYIRRIKTHLSSPSQVVSDTTFVGGCEASPLIQPLQIRVINNLFEQTMTKFRGPERSELTYLWLMWKRQEFELVTKDVVKKEKKNKAKELKQFAKKLLSEDVNRNDLRVWEGYAVVEWAIGNTEEGDKVMTSALSMTALDLKAGHLTANACQAGRLYRLYAEHIFKAVSLGQAKNDLLYMLVTLAGNEKYKVTKESPSISSVQLLKARRAFQAGLDCLLSGETLTGIPPWDVIRRGCLLEHWTICYVLFEYVTSDLKTAHSLFEQVIPKLESHLESQKSMNVNFLTNPASGYDAKATFQACLRERLLVSSVSLAQHHVLKTVTPLRVVRDPLMIALFKLPDALPLLQTFMDTESSANILGQLRRRLLPVAKKANTSLPWIIAVLGELKRQNRMDQQQQDDLFTLSVDKEDRQWKRNTIHSLRSWIERALSTPAASNSLLLWRLSMFLEKEYGSIDNVKAVFYRSIQQCPWAKSLYVDFATYCPDHLQEVCDLLTEKELRLRTPIEELRLLYKGATTLKALNQESKKPSEPAGSFKSEEKLETSDNSTDANIQHSKDTNDYSTISSKDSTVGDFIEVSQIDNQLQHHSQELMTVMPQENSVDPT